MHPRVFIALVVTLLAALAAVFMGIKKQVGVRSYGYPVGRVVRAGSQLAVVMQRCDPYIPSLQGTAESKKSYSFELLLVPETATGDTRTTSLARSVRSGDRRHYVGVQHVESGILWYSTSTTAGLDLATLQPVKMPVPAVVANKPISELIGSSFPADEPYRARIAQIGPDEWLMLATELDARNDLKSGFGMPRNSDAERTFKPRTLYRVTTKSDPKPRIETFAPITQLTIRNAAFLRKAQTGELYRFTQPDGFLIVHEGDPSTPTTLRLSRMHVDGSLAWTTDTTIERLTQLLPHDTLPAFVGELVKTASPINPHPAIVVVNVTDGTMNVKSLVAPAR
jgi:hypothetical protein